MSLLALLAATSGEAMGGGTVDPLPATADATLRAIRPNGRRIGLLTVGAGKDYANIKDANAAAKALQTTRLAAEGASNLTPNYRVDVVVDPGTYVGEVVSGRFVAFYANGSGVLLKQNPTGTPALGVLETTGDTYWEGINITQDDEPDAFRPKYPIHAQGKGTSIYANCTLTNNESDVTTAFGMDGYDGGTTLLYKVTMGPGGTNSHGAVGTRVPQTTMYVDCVTPGVNWNAMNDIAADHLWVVGGIVNIVSMAGVASTMHLDPATVVSGSSTPVSGSKDARTDWPVPVGGLSASDRALYGM